jgi:hypothetical protein
VASWTDGPEYAPVERPAAFAAPVAEPLTGAPPRPDLSAGAPIQPPDLFQEPHDHVVPLAALVPALGPGRDPQQPFQVESAVMTASSAWGSAHSAAAVAAPNWHPPVGSGWTADQPYASSYAPPTQPGRFPAPGTPQWFGPGAEWAPPPPPIPATLPNALRATTTGVLIVLAIGGLISLLSPFLLVTAAALATQVHYRRQQVRTAFLVAMGVAVASAALPIAGGRGIDGAIETIGLVSLLGCWVMLVTVLLLQYTGLSAGDRPTD